MNDPRTDRIAEHLERLEPPAVRLARVRLDVARRDLQHLIRANAPARLVQAHRYRADRAADMLADAWRQATAPAT